MEPLQDGGEEEEGLQWGQACTQAHLLLVTEMEDENPMFPRACLGWPPLYLGQTWGKGREGILASGTGLCV